MALFGRYEYERELGQGATGRVFSARDLADGGALRALKVVSGAERARLVWEFERLCQVEHSGVARVRELLRTAEPVHAPYGLPADTLILVEDLAPGVPLARIRGPDDESVRARWIASVAVAAASALAALHASGLVHGDVKPDNVLVDLETMRTTLVDLGFAGVPSCAEPPRGTPRYMAPELFSGVRSPAADVYALGGLMFDWLSGEAGERSASRMPAGFLLRRVEALEGMCPAPLLAVIALFLQADPASRPEDGEHALRALGPVAAELGVATHAASELLHGALAAQARAARARTLPFVGRVGVLEELLAKLQQGGVVLVRGASGAGRTRLVREALRRMQLSYAGKSGRSPPTVVGSFAGLARVERVPAILCLEPSERELAAEIARAQRLLAVREEPLSVVIVCGPLCMHDDVPHVDVKVLNDAELRDLLRVLLKANVSDALLHAAGSASQRMAGRLCELVAQRYARGEDPSDPRNFRALGFAEASALSAEATLLAGMFAWWGEPLEPAWCATLLSDFTQRMRAFDELWAHGLLQESPLGLVLIEASAREVRGWLRARSGELVRGLAAQRPARHGYALLALDRPVEAEVAFLREAEALRQRGLVDEAAALLSEAVSWHESAALRWLWADTERARAAYGAALLALGDHTEWSFQLLRSEILRLSGQREAARVLAEQLVADAPQPFSARGEALLARLCFDTGDWPAARTLAERAEQRGDTEAWLRARELMVVLELAAGVQARALADSLVTRARALGARRALSRALSLRAQLFARNGERALAVQDAREASQHARDLGEVHEAATYALNLGLLELEAGTLGVALETLREAAQRLSRIDRPADTARVLFNLAAAALLAGDEPRAQTLLGLLETKLADADVVVRALVAVLRADLLMRQGQLEAACLRLEDALADVPSALSPTRALLAARAAQARVLRGEPARAEAHARAAQRWSDVADRGLRLEVCVAEVRVALATDEVERAEQLVGLGLADCAGQAPFAETVRFLLAAIAVASAREDHAALRERSALCRALLEAALSGLSAPERARMRDWPEYARVLGADVDGAALLELDERKSRWRALVGATRRLFAAPSRARIAEQLSELALELVHAERALLIARNVDGMLTVVARAELSAEASRVPYSRSVVERVLLERAALLTVDAAHDVRLHSAQSIHTLQVRSVLAVPIQGFRDACVLYLDDRLRMSAFSSEDAALLEDLCALAREALWIARTRHEDRRRARKAEAEASGLVRTLEQKLLVSAGQAVPPLVGTSGALLLVLERARRVAASDVPLLITGESGTGKELLARFVHDQSARASRTFVAESCAALPDSLIESALFGHVRGAFTGADRNRRGLFEIADGGTLFLDEVAEMSPALQAKLLRVLQERRFRPLGSEREKTCDVRVVAATKRDLATLVHAGQFREDLYYRLAVVTIDLPPLRARREDIPLLVRHFVDKHTPPGRKVRIGSGALRAFSLRDYPGNVRQLENEVRRAIALCHDDGIEASDVEEKPSVAAAEPVHDALHLHTRLEALTATLVEEALQRAGGNVTQAAQHLGISRYGLQKMLKRLGTRPQRK